MLDSGLLSPFQLCRSIRNGKVPLLRTGKRDHYARGALRRLLDFLSRFLKLGDVTNQTETSYTPSVSPYFYFIHSYGVFFILFLI